MTTGKISAVCGVPGGAFPAIKPGTTQNVAVGAASAQSAAVGAQRCRVGQKKGTPWRKPRSSGGSPA